MELKIKALANQPSIDSNLYRYVTIDKLLDFLINQRIALTRLNLFEDKLEGVTSEHLLINLTSNNISKHIAGWFGETFKEIALNIEPDKRNSLRRQRIDFQQLNYANCWFINSHESVAMWQLYSRPDSVAIKIPYQSLINEITNRRFDLTGYNLKSLRFGKVNYCRFDELEELNRLVLTKNIQGFVKDKSFEHEQEFRLMLSLEANATIKVEKKEFVLDEQIEDFNKRFDLKVIHLNFSNFAQMQFEIIFHPLSMPWHRQNIEDIINKYNLNFITKTSSLTEIFSY